MQALMLISILFPAAFACAGWPLLKKSFSNTDDHMWRLLLFVSAFTFISCIILAMQPDGTLVIPHFCGLGLSFRLDGFRRIYIIVLSFMWMMISAFCKQYFKGHRGTARLYFFLMLTEGAITGLFLSDDLFTALIFFEIMSFASAPWVFHEESVDALKAGGTYLAIAVIGGLFSLLGILLLNSACGTLSLPELASAAASCTDRPLLYTAGGLILAGFGAKAGMFPLHIWLPKAHPAAPAPASALLSGALTKAGIWGILAISCTVFSKDAAWGRVLLIFGTATMLFGAVLALLSVNLKRTLACSSMSQIGFILIGIAMTDLLGADNALAARGTLLHMMNHSIFKLVLFLCAGTVFMNTGKLDLNDIRGFGKSKPLLNVCFLLGAAGIAGIPGLSGYISKTLLHEAIVEGASIYGGTLRLVEWVFLLSGGLTFAYMAKLYICIFVEKSPDKNSVPQRERCLSKLSAAALAGSAVLIPVLGLTAPLTMDCIAETGTDFMNAGSLPRPVGYYSLESLKGALISIAAGVVFYVILVRRLTIKNDKYINRLPARLDLEELFYRPLLLKWLPSIAGLLAHIICDLPDALILLLRRTLLRDRDFFLMGGAERTLSYRLGNSLDKLMVKRRQASPDEHRFARLFYRATHTITSATHDLFDSMSFSLFLLVLAICAILIYILVIYG